MAFVVMFLLGVSFRGSDINLHVDRYLMSYSVLRTVLSRQAIHESSLLRLVHVLLKVFQGCYAERWNDNRK